MLNHWLDVAQREHVLGLNTTADPKGSWRLWTHCAPPGRHSSLHGCHMERCETNTNKLLWNTVQQHGKILQTYYLAKEPSPQKTHTA